MKTLVCAAAALIVVSLLQSASASRIDFQASVSNIYPVVTKRLTLRCAVKQDTHTDDANRTSINQPEVQSAISALRKMSVLQTQAAATQQATREVRISIETTHTHPTTESPHTHPSTGFSHSTATSHPHTTVGHHDATHGNVSYIESIIISRLDTTTGQLQSIAWLLPNDPPATSNDPDNIKVNGTIDSTDKPQEGYLEIWWEYPTEAQSGVYVCDIYGFNSTVRPVYLKSSVHVGASETTVSQLAGLVAQHEKQLVQLQQSLTDATNRISNLKQENQRQFEALNNTTDTLFNKTNAIKSQNIQIGNVNCSNTFVTFPKPYSNIPTVFISIADLRGTYSSFTFSVAIQGLTSTGFIPFCTLSQSSSAIIKWIAVDN